MTGYEELLRQHNEILTHLERLEFFVGRDGAALPSHRARPLLKQHLGALRSCLTAHFAAEEEDGYMSQVLAARPEFERRVAQAQAEHEELLNELAALQLRAEHTTIAKLKDPVGHFIRSLRRHEARESSLVQDAALEDLGAGG